MAQPPPYTRQYNFNDYSTSNPSTPHLGSKIDLELDTLKATVDAINNNIALVQRDDGKLKNLSVHAESLSNAVLTLIKATENGYGVKGSWTASTAYAVGDLVESSQATYLCFEAHTSGSTFGANSSKFILLANAAIQTTASAVDKFSGNATTVTFNLTNNSPSGDTDVLVFINGSLREPTVDYQVTSSQITFTTAPSSGTNNVIIWGTSTAVEAAKQAALTASGTAQTHRDDANEHKQTANLWANKVDGTVTDVDTSVDSNEYSAKAYASSTDSHEPPTGSSKSWATQDTTAVASSLFSAKEYASGTSATGGTSKEWAQKSDGAVDTEFSAKAYASVTGTHAPTEGSAKEWATNAGSAEVKTSEGYSAKAYAQDTTASADTTGGSAKGWASTAEDTAVPGASSTDYSAKHWAAKATTQATNATNQNRFLAPASSDPTQRSDGSSLQTGDMYFHTSQNKMKIRNSAGSFQDTSASIEGVAHITEYTGSQATNSRWFAFTHDVGLQIVWLNGVRQVQGSDYYSTNANNSTTNITTGSATHIYFISNIATTDVISLMGFGQIDSSAVVAKSGGTYTGAVIFEAGTTHNTGSNTFTLPTIRGTDAYVLTRDDSVGTGGTSWKETVTPPSITNISGEINEDTNTTLTVTGSAFVSGMTIKLINSSTGADITGHTALSYSGSSSPITVTIPSATTNITAGTQVKLHITKQGLTTTSNAITVSEDPNWDSTFVSNKATFATISDLLGASQTVGTLNASAGAGGGTIVYASDDSSLDTTYFSLASNGVITTTSTALTGLTGSANYTEAFNANAKVQGSESTKNTLLSGINIIVVKSPVGGDTSHSSSLSGAFMEYNDGTNNYRVHKFISTSGTHSFTLYDTRTVDIFVLGGGGSGGGEGSSSDDNYGGAGGSGGALWRPGKSLVAGTYTITVGPGGENNGTTAGQKGSNSIFTNSDNSYTLTGLGGGAGQNNGANVAMPSGGDGGSGAGAGRDAGTNANVVGESTQTNTEDSSATAYGNDGGNAGGIGCHSGGGGGGLGQVGYNGGYDCQGTPANATIGQGGAGLTTLQGLTEALTTKFLWAARVGTDGTHVGGSTEQGVGHWGQGGTPVTNSTSSMPSVIYIGGGGGGAYEHSTLTNLSRGGLGGGGRGGSRYPTGNNGGWDGGHALDNTGGGGGSGQNYNITGSRNIAGHGGSGVVLIRYQI